MYLLITFQSQPQRKWIPLWPVKSLCARGYQRCLGFLPSFDFVWVFCFGTSKRACRLLCSLGLSLRAWRWKVGLHKSEGKKGCLCVCAWRASVILGPPNGAGLHRGHGGAASSSYTVQAKPRHQSSGERDKLSKRSGWLKISFSVISIPDIHLLNSCLHFDFPLHLFWLFQFMKSHMYSWLSLGVAHRYCYSDNQKTDPSCL